MERCKLAVESALVVILLFAMAALYWFMLTMNHPYGYADRVYLELEAYSGYFTALGVTAACTTVLLVTMDVLFWRGIFYYVARVLILANVALYYLTALAGSAYFPASSIAVYLTLCPFVLLMFKLYVLRGMDTLDFMQVVGMGLVMVSICSLGLFLDSVFAQNQLWDDGQRLEYYVRLECLPPATTSNEQEVFCSGTNTTLTPVACVHKSAQCDEAFLFYVSPLVLVMFAFAMGSAVWLIAHTERMYAELGKSRMGLPVRAFVTFLLLGFLGLWCASGIGGADIGLSNVVFTFVFLFLVIGCGAIIVVEGIAGFKDNLTSQPLVARVLGWGNSDWMRSLLLVLFFPLFFIVLPLAMLNQLGRRLVGRLKTEEERALWLSVEVSRRLIMISRWNWTSVWGKCIWWGVIFFTLSVIGARFINVFFSWLQAQFVANNIGVAPASAIFVAVGFVTFMLPPIPGVPVYIACSVIIVPVCMHDGWDFWASWLYCSVLALAMRLLAVAGEQVMIGQWFGSNSVAVRRTIGVNSVEMRAIKFILMKRGLTPAKVACLVGGPDWPMCVTAGILRTSLSQNLLGSLPVFFVILPVTLAGALILKRNEGGAWASAGTMALAVTAGVQTLMLGAAAYYIENTVQMHREELMQWPDDEEVKKYDDISNQRARKRAYVSQWCLLPAWLKFVLISGVVLEIASAYLFQLFGARCFLNFEITDSISVVLNDNVFNIIKPLGWVGIGMFAYGCLSLIVLGRWISFKVRNAVVPDEEVVYANEMDDSKPQQITARVDPEQ